MNFVPLDISTDVAVLTYGATATVLSILPTYLWHSTFKSNENLNQVGFKVSAYSSFYFWLPSALLTPFFFLVRNFKFFDYYIKAMKISVIAPWGFNLLSLYYLLKFSSSNLRSTVLFGVYNAVLMVFQLIMIPLLQTQTTIKQNYIKEIPEQGSDE